VLAIERRDERAVQPLQRLMRQLVGEVLLLADLLQRRRDLRKLPRQRLQMLGRADSVAGQALEQVEENRVFRQQVKHRGPTSLPRVWSPLPLRERVRVRGKTFGLITRTLAQRVRTITPHPSPLPQGEREQMQMQQPSARWPIL